MQFEEYKKMYDHSVKDPSDFWAEQAETLTWYKKWTKVKETSFTSPVSIKWFEGGELNVSYNCIDRHLATRGDKVALIWESDSPDVPSKSVTYKELYKQVCLFANVLKKNGVKRGDRVTLYMPMILEAAYAMLACTRIGATHSVIFGGFAPDSIADRILNFESDFVITADQGLRGTKIIPLKANVDTALKRTPGIRKVLVVRHTGNAIDMQTGRDLWYHDEVKNVNAECEPERMNAEDPLFLLYTSGSTGKPKGILHTTAGYLLYVSRTHALTFDLQEDDVYWCTADIGWVTGHSYLVYGPLANGGTSLMFEGVPSYPTPSRFWEVVDKHKVTIFYTAPTAIRALMREGDEPVKRTSRKSLRILGSVGEPINPEAWQWYHKVVGDSRCPIIDTWWQTETGGFMITPIVDAFPLKPGSASLPFFGVKPVMLTPEGGQRIDGPGEGVLAIEDSWPGQSRSIYNDHKRFEETYFSAYKGYYFSGDGCRRDKDGYFWVTGRVDDVLNVSGHRIGTAEIESALVGHSGVSEAAVVGYPHDVKGTGIYAFVTLCTGIEGSEAIRKELIQHVRTEIGAFAAPEKIQWAPGLPKTRSGKIMRRILRKIAENQPDQLGDITTLAEPAVVEDLVKNRLNQEA